MRIVHCECGLGNQMCYYAQYVALKKVNPNSEVLLETFLFDIPELKKYMKMWNGYELFDVFGIKAQNVKLYLSVDYEKVKQAILESEFWKIDWTASAGIITKILFQNNIIDENSIDTNSYSRDVIKSIYVKYRNSFLGYILRRIVWLITGKSNPSKYGRADLFDSANKKEYYSNLFSIIRPNSGINTIREELVSAFSFPPLKDEKNVTIAREMSENNSVSIHVRKSDCYKYNADCFKFGYFKRSIRYIRKNVEQSVFYIFSDDPQWILENKKIIGLKENDDIRFVNWNNGKNSYIDLQLMSICKHNISTNSTFGFWASFLNKNPNKITCAPIGSFAVTNWF